jgi:hypothetical protein
MKPIHSLKVKIVESNQRKVKIRLMNANRILSVPKKAFEQRCERGFYDVVNPALLESRI